MNPPLLSIEREFLAWEIIIKSFHDSPQFVSSIHVLCNLNVFLYFCILSFSPMLVPCWYLAFSWLFPLFPVPLQRSDPISLSEAQRLFLPLAFSPLFPRCFPLLASCFLLAFSCLFPLLPFTLSAAPLFPSNPDFTCDTFLIPGAKRSLNPLP